LGQFWDATIDSSKTILVNYAGKTVDQARFVGEAIQGKNVLYLPYVSIKTFFAHEQDPIPAIHHSRDFLHIQIFFTEQG
jgi:hypothetical protein